MIRSMWKRWFGRPAAPPNEQPARSSLGDRTDTEPAVRAEPSGSDAVAGAPARRGGSGHLVDEMIRLGRSALLLRQQIADNLTREEHARALAALEDHMALVPQGEVLMLPTLSTMEECATPPVLEVDAIFLDRRPVTNEAFQAFVEAGGYEQMPLWDESVWAALLDFVDRTGRPGPATWRDGTCPPGLENHPVVGISWYEASAYARWVGKRLPTGPEWVKAASWPVATPGGKPCQRRFPWGDTMDRCKTRLWDAEHLGTVAVDATPGGSSVGGIEQMIGNVWEWTDSPYACWDPAAERLDSTVPLQGIRGGSFTTYFDNQATCQFQSGESPLSRRDNIGFRCALSLCDVAFLDAAPSSACDADASLSWTRPVEETSV